MERVLRQVGKPPTNAGLIAQALNLSLVYVKQVLTRAQKQGLVEWTDDYDPDYPPRVELTQAGKEWLDDAADTRIPLKDFLRRADLRNFRRNPPIVFDAETRALAQRVYGAKSAAPARVYAPIKLNSNHRDSRPSPKFRGGDKVQGMDGAMKLFGPQTVVAGIYDSDAQEWIYYLRETRRDWPEGSLRRAGQYLVVGRDGREYMPPKNTRDSARKLVREVGGKVTHGRHIVRNSRSLSSKNKRRAGLRRNSRRAVRHWGGQYLVVGRDGGEYLPPKNTRDSARKLVREVGGRVVFDQPETGALGTRGRRIVRNSRSLSGKNKRRTSRGRR